MHISSGQRAHYVALSHCWGQKQPLTTKKSSLADRQAGIPMSTLPRTFAEAVSVVRETGLQFLWIDSLCIVQNSTTDWEVESSKMGDYYWNAFLTIAAADSIDSSFGLFRERDSASVHPCVTTARFSSAEGKVSDTFPLALAPAIEDSRDWRYDGIPVPLDERGWVLQEKILPPRLVTFGQLQLSFVCLQMMASENCPSGRIRGESYIDSYADLQHALHSAGRWHTKHGDRDGSSLDGSGMISNSTYHSWYGGVREFSRRKLTKGSDVLPALSGPASRFQKNQFVEEGEQYLAGLWKGDIINGLLWHLSGLSAVPKPEEADCTGPSWS